jgi:hypothetical protein
MTSSWRFETRFINVSQRLLSDSTAIDTTTAACCSLGNPIEQEQGGSPSTAPCVVVIRLQRNRGGRHLHWWTSMLNGKFKISLRQACRYNSKETTRSQTCAGDVLLDSTVSGSRSTCRLPLRGPDDQSGMVVVTWVYSHNRFCKKH